MSTPKSKHCNELDDLSLARLIANKDPAAVRMITQKNNKRLFRTAWSILKDTAEAEDAVQSAYLRAFAAIQSFQGRSTLSTWLTRVVINEALQRQRADQRRREILSDPKVVFLAEYRESLMREPDADTTPEADVARGQVRELLEQAISSLPRDFRTVFVLREVEGLSIDETSEVLGVNAATVKTRAYRARQRLQQMLEPHLRATLKGTFPFAGADCERITQLTVLGFCGVYLLDAEQQ